MAVEYLCCCRCCYDPAYRSFNNFMEYNTGQLLNFIVTGQVALHREY